MILFCVCVYVAEGCDVGVLLRECGLLREQLQQKDAYIHRLMAEKIGIQVCIQQGNNKLDIIFACGLF